MPQGIEKGPKCDRLISIGYLTGDIKICTHYCYKNDISLSWSDRVWVMTKALSPIHVKHIDEKYMMKLMRIDYSWLILPDSWYLITA